MNTPISGIELAGMDNPEHAAMLNAMKEQLLIVLVNRLGGNVTIPVNEIDSTGGYVLLMEANLQQQTFTFTTAKKS
jgi:hypothetical protein